MSTKEAAKAPTSKLNSTITISNTAEARDGIIPRAWGTRLPEK